MIVRTLQVYHTIKGEVMMEDEFTVVHNKYHVIIMIQQMYFARKMMYILFRKLLGRLNFYKKILTINGACGSVPQKGGINIRYLH